MLVSFWYLVDNHAIKDDLRFLEQLRGVNEGSNGDRIIFKHYKNVGLIQNNITIKMSRVIGWQLQYGFHDEQSFYSSYRKAQGGATSTW
jgi:hypothetical protein